MGATKEVREISSTNVCSPAPSLPPNFSWQSLLIAFTAPRAARPGEVIMFYGTGFGPTQPAQLAGTAVVPSVTAARVTAAIGNQPAVVEYSGVVLPGTYQMNIRIPELPNGYHPITAEIAGFKTQDKVVVLVQR